MSGEKTIFPPTIDSGGRAVSSLQVRSQKLHFFDATSLGVRQMNRSREVSSSRCFNLALRRSLRVMIPRSSLGFVLDTTGNLPTPCKAIFSAARRQDSLG